MRVDNHLDAILAGAPGCRVAAFADLTARTVLAVRADRRHPQEVLDRLCADAAEALDGPLSTAAAVIADEGPVDEALRLGADDACLFLRSPAEPGEALCCIIAPGAATDPVRAAARDAMGRIADLTA